MQNLSDFLKKFSKLKNPKEDRRAVAEIISKTLGFNILPDEIIVKDGVVKVLKLGKIKTEVFIKKDLILQEINKNIPKLNVQDIV